MTEPTSTNANIEQLEKDPPLRIPDTYVEGIVYNGSNPFSGATVQLLDADNQNNVLEQTTTNSNGYYSMCVCCYGYGKPIVKATYFQKPPGILLTDSKYFIFSYETGRENDWLFEINLNLQPY